MCGISGLFYAKGVSAKGIAKQLNAVNTALQHRGPDDSGMAIFYPEKAIPVTCSNAEKLEPKVKTPYTPLQHFSALSQDNAMGGFGHRRLSIIDLSAMGHQPMSSKCGNFWITYNGEVYNYIEIRKELEHLGCTFLTQTDTEVVLQAYQFWGEKCLHRFNGMFAFAIYNRQTKTIFAARDRTGVKPFYYIQNASLFAFASEVKALKKLDFISFSLNPNAVYHYFINDKIEEKTEQFFQEVQELEAGTYLLYEATTHHVTTHTYFTAEPMASPYNVAQEYQEELYTLLQEAIRLRLRADVPVGVSLSGGLDSSTIAYFTKQLIQDKPTQFYTACYTNKALDESNYAALLMDSPLTQWHKIYPEQNSLVRKLEEFIFALDLPLWSTSTFAQFSVMEKVKETGIKVLLSGQGGDELFAGYERYLNSFAVENFTKLNLNNGLRHFQPKRGLKALVRASLPKRIQQGLYLKNISEGALYNRSFVESYAEAFGSAEIIKSSLNQHLAGDLNNSVLKRYLRCEDRCSMHFSIESRTPFSDDINLIQYALSLPATLKIKHGFQKYALRKTMEGKLPDALVWRADKMGYTTPNAALIKALAPTVAPYFENPVLKDFLDITHIKKHYSAIFSANSSAENPRIFKFLAFAVWCKVNGVG
ncbi:MAG: asparagine synthase (glutamine-hydrolyzing) [Luteibaculaceae bacterium]